MSEALRPDEQAVSQVVELGLTSQLESVEEIKVDVHTNWLEAILGRANSISIAGKGLVMQEEIRVQEMQMRLDDVAINPLSALLGQVQLDQPTDTTLRMVFTEADLNHAMNTDFASDRLPPIHVNVDGEMVAVQLHQPMSLQLLAGGRMKFTGQMRLEQGPEVQNIEFSGTLHPRSDRRPLLLEEFSCGRGQGLTLPFTIALMKTIQDWLNQPYWEVEGTAVQVKKLEIEGDRLIVEMTARVRQIPSLEKSM